MIGRDRNVAALRPKSQMDQRSALVHLFDPSAAFTAERESRVVGTGVDPVTYRFSGGRSAN